jgi:hypothetical protein
MPKKIDHYKKSLHIFEQLYKQYPHLTLGQHIATAFEDYGDIWGITSKEFTYALEKYASQLELDIQQIAPQDYVDKIVKDTEDIFNEIEDDEEDFN